MTRSQPTVSQVRILKDPRSRQPEGAGFLISGNYILTCAHVAESVTRKSTDPVYIDFPLLEKHPVLTARIAALFPISDTPSFGKKEDICLLEIVSEELPPGAKPAAFIKPSEDMTDRSIRIFGFPKETDDGDWADGRISGPNARGWLQIDHDLTGNEVAPGFSGTPVWDKAKGRVVGMMVAETVRSGKKTAWMIPASVLAKAVPECMSAESAQIGRAAPKLCNRDIEDRRFQDFFHSCCTECPGTPQFYIIPGNADDCHLSMIERFQMTCIRNVLRANGGRSVSPLLKRIAWPFEGDPELRKSMLSEDLFRFEPNYAGTYSAADFFNMCRRLDLKKHEIILLVHDIPAELWDHAAETLTQWYLSEFWNGFECSSDLPLFLIFLNLKYPGTDIGRFDSVKWFFTKKRLTASLKRIMEHQTFRCLMFDELKKITRHHADAWFSKYDICMDEKEKEDRLQSVFNRKRCVSMRDLEACLETIVKEIDRKMSGLHPDAKEFAV